MKSSKLVVWVVAGGVVFLLLPCLGFSMPLELLAYLLGGWAYFLYRNIGLATFDPGQLVLAILALGFLVAVAHHLLSGWYSSALRRDDSERDAKAISDQEGASRKWRWRWTMSAVGIVLAAFVAGTSLVGFAHQCVWLATDDQPILQSSIWQAVHRMQTANNLKQIGLGANVYHDGHESLPAGATADARGRLLHSWQTQLLPYIEQAELAARIQHDRPWDDPVNAPAMKVVVSTYLLTNRVPEKLDAQGRALTCYSANAFVLGGTRPMKLNEIADGASDTILAGEVVENRPAWGYPRNWRDPRLGINRHADGFGSPRPSDTGVAFLMADVSVRYLSRDVDPRVLAALATPAGNDSPNESDE